MAASTARRHETRALLRAHLAAASGYRHLTRHCPICHRLLRLAMERAAEDPTTGDGPPPSRRRQAPDRTGVSRDHRAGSQSSLPDVASPECRQEVRAV